MTSIEFANKVISMPAGVMFCNADKYEAVKNAVRDQLCEEFYGHSVEPRKNTNDDTFIVNMYSNSIL